MNSDAQREGAAAAKAIRSEKQLHVTTRRVPVRRARLERVQITEMITMEVPVLREDVRIVYDTIDQDVRGDGPRSEPPRPWVPRGERIVITKEWVPLETVALTVQTVTEQQQVTDDARKEQITLENASTSATAAVSGAGQAPVTAAPPAAPVARP